MDSDAEKQQNNYQMDEVDGKKDHEDDLTEVAPLKGEYTNADGKENDTSKVDGTTTTSGKDGQGKGFREWFSKSRVKWWIAVLVAIILLGVVLVGTLLAVDTQEEYTYVNGVRLMQIWPRPNRPNNIIAFKHGSMPLEGGEWPNLTRQLDKLMQKYEYIASNRSRNVTECFDNFQPEGTVCFFDVRPIALECSRAMNFGYADGKPCIFLQFTNLTNWKPEPFTTLDLEMMSELPQTLRTSYKPSVAFLDCQGDSIVDRENMGPVQYSPERGFHLKFFPYRGQYDYMPPFVAVHFQKPAVGVAISITCKLWAKNINNTDDSVPSGKLSFSLLVD